MTNSYSNNHMSLNSNLVKCYVSSLNRINNSFPFTVAYQKDTDGFCYKSYESYENFIETCFNEEDNPEMRRWNEVVLEDRQIIEFYDLDGKLGSELFNYCKENGEDNTIKEFLSARKVFIRRYFPKYNVKEEKIAISTAYNDTKFSVHITIRNGFYFKNAYTLKTFCLKFQEYLKDTPFTIDMNPYKKNTNFRMLYNTKVSQDRYLKKHHLSADIPDKDFLISYIKPEDVLFDLEETTKPFNFIKKEKNCDIGKDNQEMTQLLNLINSDCDDDLWRGVAQSIYNLTEGSKDGLEKFIEWSKKDGFIDFNENKCIDKWNKLRNSSDWNGLDYLKGKAKKENPEEYYEIYEKKNDQDCSPEIVFIDDDITFNDKVDIKKEDNYYWVDFERKYMNTVFRDYEDLKQNIIQDLPRVLVKITMDEGFYIKKEHKDVLCNLIQIKKMKRISFKYNLLFSNKKGEVKNEILDIKLDDIYTKCRLPLYSHPDMILDKNIKSSAYNIFKGIRASIVEKIDMDLINKFFTHIETIICNDHKEASHFFISWMRWIMVYPHIKTKIFVFLFSKEGYGKSTIGNFLSHYIFGDTASHISSGLDSLTSGFNKHLLGKLFCQIEELPSTSENFHKQFDNMKTLITDDKMFCNPKGVDGFKINNFLNFLGCSNNKYSLRMPQSDTRYFVQEIVKKMNGEYWNEYYKNFQNQDFANMLYSYFLQTKDDAYVKFNGRPKIPMTDLKQELIDFSLPTHERFYKDIMDGEYQLNSDILRPEFTYNGKTYKYASSLKQIYDEFQNWGMINGEKDLKKKYLEFKQERTNSFRYINLQEKITNIDTLEFKQYKKVLF